MASEGSGLEQPWTAADLSSRDPSAGLRMSSSSEGYFSDGFSSGLRQRRSLPALLPPKASFRELVHQAKAKLDAEAVEQAQARAEAAPLAVLALAPAREAGREAPRSRCDPHPCWELGLDVEAPERGTSRCQPEGLFAALDARYTSEEPPIDGKCREVVATVEEDLEEGEEQVDAATMRRRKLVEEDAGEVEYGFDEEAGSNGVRAIVESPAFDSSLAANDHYQASDTSDAFFQPDEVASASSRSHAYVLLPSLRCQKHLFRSCLCPMFF